MTKIVTLTFSPAIDKSSSIKTLIPEKKLKCTNPKFEAGGGGINVARVIAKLGGNVLAVFPSGGYTGKYFNHLLENEKVPFVSIDTKNETRENFVILEESTNKQFRFGMPSNELLETEWKACLTAIENLKDIDYIIASGSLPPGVPMNVYAQLSKIAKKINAKFVVDTSGEALKEAVDEGVFLLKPNLEELGYLLGIENLEIANIEEAAKELIHKNNCEIIVISLGKEGAMLVTKNETHTIKPPKVDVKSTVGAGDSMVAGLVYSLTKNNNLKEALMFGVSCGTAATMNKGTELCQLKDIEKIFLEIKNKY
jgi:6-phosphofructokinase 2